tara:strand:+ start:201 stop:437 length:237 start_codon:yes stop_codon:yes gene_type:complete
MNDNDDDWLSRTKMDQAFKVGEGGIATSLFGLFEIGGHEEDQIARSCPRGCCWTQDLDLGFLTTCPGCGSSIPEPLDN